MQWIHPTNGRWYRADLAVDLFGTPGIETAWGGRQRPRAGQAFEVLASNEDAEKALERIHRRRTQHGYLRLVPGAERAPAG